MAIAVSSFCESRRDVVIPPMNREFPKPILFLGGNITCGMREVLLDWMYELCDDLVERDYPRSCFDGNSPSLASKSHVFLMQSAAWYLDQYLLTHEVHKDMLQLVGATSFWMAMKLHEVRTVTASKIAEYCNGAYTSTQVQHMEVDICRSVDWFLTKEVLVQTVFKVVELCTPAPQAMKDIFLSNETFSVLELFNDVVTYDYAFRAVDQVALAWTIVLLCCSVIDRYREPLLEIVNQCPPLSYSATSLLESLPKRFPQTKIDLFNALGTAIVKETFRPRPAYHDFEDRHTKALIIVEYMNK